MKTLQTIGCGYTYEECVNNALESVSELGRITELKLIDVEWLEDKRFKCLFQVHWT